MGNSSSEPEENYPKIDTGDFMKVKQTLDDSLTEHLKDDLGFKENTALGNVKLLLMFASCCFALAAQFWPVDFPESRPVLFLCCASYFILSGVIQFIMSFIEVDMIFQTLPGNGCPKLRICTNFPRFQTDYEIRIQEDAKGTKNVATTKLFIGKVFTKKGEFWEEGFRDEVTNAIEKFKSKKYD
ncbi:unnamed protein product [Heterosigma akashiwo]|uniref:Signal peptidase complex subunit 2 n=1 Tax=Heterosigma akashiwo TaxID=2829 RepID=A0A6V1KYX0_HETAK|mmetsp:Transcript_11573/g.22448  ORF Transcript_11573/g.22448 Transcript_11573/m.22448 type:complete len:184 (-) Transcript_11573:383-934(-)